MNNNKEKVEENLLEMKKQKEIADKRLLAMEIVIGVATLILFIILVMIADFTQMEDSTRFLIIIPSTIFVFVICLVALKIEQVAGYYECRKCHHKYVPTYSKVLWAMHINRTRYMKCPECGKKSWNRKVVSK